ncbi:phage repressor protein C with HTH and peptisase S24 domain [Dysgonomonas alginatilytica]|uniref:Phage repressor protein C with HTH and peptisase S24 domain n=1 Tax=Dysgonomonas alginatilytica TaxID=1605892 RepID=A0A2V3PPF5_9BACT|nr:XRE family transcriptional regulator [Dysgonomonas alginatilytica]PXV62686.1 phage repressor protein C with HTH and peptisase S24 domain [Dysgonomonas alginatilytica]
MKSSINERIKKIVEQSSKSVRAYAEFSNIAQTTLNDCIKGSTEPKFGLIDKIITAEPNINIDWLLTGRGEMYRQENKVANLTLTIDEQEPHFVNSSGVKYYEMPNGRFRMRVPLIPVKAYAKYVDEYRDAEFVNDLEEVEFIVDKVGLGRYYAFEIKGDSMDDGSKRSICDKDIVLARELSKDYWRDRLRNDEYPFWIIILGNTIVCKQIINQDLERCEITCHSLNSSPEYADFTLSMNDISQLCNIVARQSVQF